MLDEWTVIKFTSQTCAQSHELMNIPGYLLSELHTNTHTNTQAHIRATQTYTLLIVSRGSCCSLEALILHPFKISPLLMAAESEKRGF